MVCRAWARAVCQVVCFEVSSTVVSTDMLLSQFSRLFERQLVFPKLEIVCKLVKPSQLAELASCASQLSNQMSSLQLSNQVSSR